MKKIILLLALITLTSMTGCQKKEEAVAAANNNEVEASMNLEEETDKTEEPKEEVKEDNADSEKTEDADSKNEEDSQSKEESDSKEKDEKQTAEVKTDNKSNTNTSSSNANSKKAVSSNNNTVQANTNPANVISEAERSKRALDQRYASIVNTGYSITLNGVNYTMPFEYQKMMNNNWLEHDLNLRNNTISSNIKVRNGNRTVGINLQNITDSYLIYSRCLVTGIVIDRNDAASGTSIVLPSNITMNSSKDDVIRAYGASGYNEEARKYSLGETENKNITIRFDESLQRIESIEIYNFYS